MKYSFANWLEWADFGFKQNETKPPANDPNPGPLYPVDIDTIIRTLQRFKSPSKRQEKFFGEVQMGEGPGATRLQFTPYGGVKAIVRKLSKDLVGEDRWVCKRVLEVRHLFDNNPEKLTHALDRVLNEVSNQGIDSPSNTYEETERLVMNMASQLRQARSDLLFFEGIRRTKENFDYSIHFGVHGHGVQRKDQKRVDKFLVHVAYHQNEGYLQIIGQEVDGPLRRHDWALDISQWNECHMPSQPVEEIVDCHLHMLRSY